MQFVQTYFLHICFSSPGVGVRELQTLRDIFFTLVKDLKKASQVDVAIQHSQASRAVAELSTQRCRVRRGYPV